MVTDNVEREPATHSYYRLRLLFTARLDEETSLQTVLISHHGDGYKELA